MHATQIDVDRRTCLLAALAFAGSCVGAAPAWSPEGQWAASVGTPDNRAQIGLDIARSADGSLQASLAIDLLNFFGMSLPGLRADGPDRWTIPAYEIVLTRVGSGDLFLVSAIDPQSGRNLWRTRVGGWVLQRPAVSGARVHVSLSGARRRAKHFMPQTAGLMALDRDSGRIVWHWPAPSLPGSFLHGIVAAPVVAGSRIVVGGLDGSLYAFPL